MAFPGTVFTVHVATLKSARVRAPEFPTGTWLNTERALSVRYLRGRPVLLDFWSSCCVNCLHVIEELRPLEHQFGADLVVIGVHSPKFAFERADSSVAAAVQRHAIEHPVFNDHELQLWQQYAVHAWPTLVLIDQGGYVIARAAGEGHVSAMSKIISELLSEQPPSAAIVAADVLLAPVPLTPSALFFPAKAILVQGSLLVADAGRHSLAQTDLSGREVRRRIGDGQRAFGPSSFSGPNGLAALPAELAARLGYDVVVADTGSNLLRGVRLADGEIVCTVDLSALLAGASTVTGAVPRALSPWDVAWWPALERIAVAAAGVHLLLSWDPVGSTVVILAGTTVEGLKDGPALDGWLAQPSGLAVQGERLWFVDAETSSLRWLSADGQLRTAVGEGLFDFGHVDGDATQARFQHPLGVAVLPDATIAIADTYNGAVRRYDPATESVSTLALDLAEPSGLVVSAGALLVLESAAHRITSLSLDRPPMSVLPAPPHPEPVALVLRPGDVRLTVSFTPAPGRVLDERYGPATRLSVSATPPSVLAGAGESTDLIRQLVLSTADSAGVLHVSAHAASCDYGPHATCQLAHQDWNLPFRLSPDGLQDLSLVLRDPSAT